MVLIYCAKLVKKYQKMKFDSKKNKTTYEGKIKFYTFAS